MARSTFYYHLSRLNDDKWAKEKNEISRIYAQSHKLYGYRRILIGLQEIKIQVNHKTVRKLMHKLGIFGMRGVGSHYKSYKGAVGNIADNVINRNFVASMSNCKWATDITQMKICGRKLYMSPILDMCNGEVVTYTVSEHPNLNLVLSMVKKALNNVGDVSGLILHSDQGWHYQNDKYQKLLNSHNIRQSMSRKGNCRDNSMMENFFGLMKTELLYLHKWDSVSQFTDKLKEYIEYYNNERIKLRLKTSPVKYRLAIQKH